MGKFILLLILLSGCASTPLPRAQRFFIFLETTEASKDQAYQNIHSYLVPFLKKAKATFDIENPVTARLVAPILLACKAEQKAMAKNSKIRFRLIVDIIDKKVRVAFETLEIVYYTLMGDPFKTIDFTDENDVNRLRPCAIRAKNQIINSIRVKN